MRKTLLATVLSVAMISTMFTACANDVQQADQVGEVIEDVAEAELEELVEEYSIEEEEADESEEKEVDESETEETSEEVTEPFMEDSEMYADIIDNLTDDQWYAFAAIGKGVDVLLVTDYTYDNLDGNMAAIDATIYAPNKDGEVIEYTKMQAAGTAYPLAVYDDCLYVCTGHSVHKCFVDSENGALTTKEYAGETFDTDGNATYSYLSLEEETEGEDPDDSRLKKLFDEYNNHATVINFSQK